LFGLSKVGNPVIMLALLVLIIIIIITRNTYAFARRQCITGGQVSVASLDIVGGRISPNINVATPNLVSLRRPLVLFIIC